MKRIVFTKHAEEMLSVRGIHKDMISSCLIHPTKIVDAKDGKRAYLKDLGVNYLKVIISDERDASVVVTLYWLAKHRVKL